MNTSVAKKSISPGTMLDVGTRVLVKNRVGTVQSAKMVTAVPSGVVALHKIRFTHKRTVSLGKSVDAAIKPVCDEVNYSFIEVLD